MRKRKEDEYRVLIHKPLKRLINALDGLEENIQQGINENIPNVIIDDLEVASNPDQYTVTISLKYSIAQTGLTDNVELTFQ